MRWFTSDWHLLHQNIMKFEPESRPFSTTEEMTQEIIDRHNAVVSPEDMVFVIGDAALGKIADSLPMVGEFNGRIFLVPGNHDRVFSEVAERMRNRFEPEYLKVFDQILPEQMELELADGTVVDICHFPYEGDSHGSDRYASKRPVDRGRPLIHGHVHSSWKTKGRQFNVGVDVHNLTPVSEDEIINWVQTL